MHPLTARETQDTYDDSSNNFQTPGIGFADFSHRQSDQLPLVSCSQHWKTPHLNSWLDCTASWVTGLDFECLSDRDCDHGSITCCSLHEEWRIRGYGVASPFTVGEFWGCVVAIDQLTNDPRFGYEFGATLADKGKRKVELEEWWAQQVFVGRCKG